MLQLFPYNVSITQKQALFKMIPFALQNFQYAQTFTPKC